MGLADDIKTIMDASWDGTIITKPTIKVPPHFPNNAIPKTLTIDDRLPGSWVPINADGLTDTQIENFEITVYSDTEANAILYIRATKKVLNS